MPDIRTRASVSRHRAIASALLLLGVASAATSTADTNAPRRGQPVLVSQHVIAGGGVTRAASPCFLLDATVAEPVAGRATGGGYALDAGFLAMPVAGDRLFRNGFEDCQP
ncbi:MAG: hypothetical protein EOP90_03730 [Lysobacteraceae bacterium]|nr:MAG: hypothetical protein EOP90_03730 [Xanthomonadaceae bacterium]